MNSMILTSMLMLMLLCSCNKTNTLLVSESFLYVVVPQDILSVDVSTSKKETLNISFEGIIVFKNTNSIKLNVFVDEKLAGYATLNDPSPNTPEYEQVLFRFGESIEIPKGDNQIISFTTSSEEKNHSYITAFKIEIKNQ